MKFKRYILTAIISGLTFFVGHAAMIMDIDDFEHDIIGSQPFKATTVSPSTTTGNALIAVVNQSVNTAGTGKGVRLFDNDKSVGLRFEYDFTVIADTPRTTEMDVAARLSAVRVNLLFAPRNTNGPGDDYLSITLGEHLTDQSNSSARFLNCRLMDDGTINFLSNSSPESTKHELLSTSNSLSIFANDYDSRILTYTGPDGASYDLPSNSVAYWLNGSRISFEGQGYTSMENKNTRNGTVFNSANNLGRFAVVSADNSSNLDYVFDDIAIFDLDSEQNLTGRSSLVLESLDGLIYKGYANQGQSNAVNKVPDFSSAGYRGGGVPIPFVPAEVTVSPSGDATGVTDANNIQAAIDQVSNLPIGENGFRGAVKLTAGEYTVSNTLNINTSGVVIRGAGSHENGGTRITFNSTANNKPDLFLIKGSPSSPSEITGTRTAITDPYVPMGTKQFNVSDATGYTQGDSIIIQMMVNDQWLTDLGMGANTPGNPMGNEAWSTGYYRGIKYRRTVTAVEGNTISVDVPALQTIENLYGGAEIYKYSHSDGLENVGIESLRLESTYANENDINHGWDAIHIENLENGWVRQVTARHFAFSLVNIRNYSRHITVEDCATLDPVNSGGSGQGYSFVIDESDSVLWQRCLTRGGRHDFASGSRVQGPNVFVDCRATETKNDIGPHHRYSTGQLYDNIFGGEMNVQNRLQSGSGHGWAGAQIMFWNCDASSIICDAPTGAMNWVVGSSAEQLESDRTPNEPFGIWDSPNQAVTPRSLYYAQLADRLGTNVLNKIILPQQKNGNIWAELLLWDGDGLFLDDVAAWADEEPVAKTGIPIQIGGIIRNLQMLDRGNLTYHWSKVSGPGSVSFANSASLETTANFSQEGSYVLNLSVDDGTTQASAILPLDILNASSVPKAPSNLFATAEDSTIFLNWDDNDEADLESYTVYRSLSSDGEYTAVGTNLSLSEFEDRTVANNTIYFYVVTATDSDGDESLKSNKIFVTPLPDTTPPAAPRGLTAMAGDKKVFLDWDDNVEADFQSYSVFRRLESSNDYTAISINTDISEFEDTSVTNQTKYYYVITATDEKGNESLQSYSVSAIPRDPVSLFSTSFGNNNDGLGGFTTSTLASAQESWAVEADGVRYENDSASTVNSSLLQNFTLDRSAGKSYIIEAVFSPTGGYADDNNRIGVYLFGDVADLTVSGGPGQDESGALSLLYNFDKGLLSLNQGIDRNQFLSSSTNPNRAGDDSIFNPDHSLKLTMKFSFNKLGELLLEGIFEDENGNTTSLATTLIAEDYTGNYFGLITRARNRDNSNPTFVIDYKSFTILDASPTTDSNAIDDEWEQYYFGTTGIDGSADPDNDGSANFFEYLYGSDPTDPASKGFQVQISATSNRNMIALSWKVNEGFIFGAHYKLEVSTDLESWSLLPVEHYSLTESTANEKTDIELILTRDYGSKAFFRIAKTELK